MPKKTFIYALYDPREPEEIRYIGKANNPRARLNSHISESLRIETPIWKADWIRTLISDGLKPEMKVLEEVSYDISIEWEDREVYYIAYYFSKGHRLENSTLGGSDNYNLPVIRERHRLWHINKNLYTKYKLDEAIMATRSNCLTPEKAWKLRKDFYENRLEYVESEINLRISSHHINTARFLKLGGRTCPECGLSIENDIWLNNKHLFIDSQIKPEEYTPERVNGDKIISCNCIKDGMTYLRFPCHYYDRIRSYYKSPDRITGNGSAENSSYLKNRYFDPMRLQCPTDNDFKNFEKIKIRSFKILLVDDYPDRLFDAKRLLSDYGHYVELARNGAKTIDKLRRSVFDVVLMTLRMSEMDGTELTHLIRETEVKTLLRTPVVAMIDPRFEYGWEQILSTKFDGHIPSPIQIDLLHMEFVKIFGNQRVAGVGPS